jgi:hypothetical protein
VRASRVDPMQAPAKRVTAPSKHLRSGALPAVNADPSEARRPVADSRRRRSQAIAPI